MKKVIFVYPIKASFIKLDIEILSKKYKVVENTYNWKNKKAVPFYLIQQFFFLLKNLRSADSVVVSFGGYWSFLPALLGRMFKKPVYIILHGTDCISFKEINYGNISKPILRYFLKVSYKNATGLLPVSNSLIYTENNYYSDQVIKQGYKHFFKNNTTDNRVVHNAIDSVKWHVEPGQQRHSNRFITVLTNGQYVRKGGELIVAAASKLPNHEFYFVGMDRPNGLENVPDNVKFISRQTPEQLLTHYNNSKYYLQLSIIEGFGCALGEAMACGCIPIVSNVNMLPEIIGDSGYVLNKRKVDDFVSLVQNLDLSRTGDLARKQIIDNFPLEKRENALYEVIDN